MAGLSKNIACVKHWRFFFFLLHQLTSDPITFTGRLGSYLNSTCVFHPPLVITGSIASLKGSSYARFQLCIFIQGLWGLCIIHSKVKSLLISSPLIETGSISSGLFKSSLSSDWNISAISQCSQCLWAEPEPVWKLWKQTVNVFMVLWYFKVFRKEKWIWSRLFFVFSQ